MFLFKSTFSSMSQDEQTHRNIEGRSFTEFMMLGNYGLKKEKCTKEKYGWQHG